VRRALPLLISLLSAAVVPGLCADNSAAPDFSTNQAIGHYRQGYALVAQKNYPAASHEFQAAINLNPKFGQAYFWLGVCYAQQNFTPPAITAFQNALATTRDTKLLPVIHYDLGVQYLKAGQKAEADQEYQTAVRLNPEFAHHPMVKQAPSIPPAASPLPESARQAQAHFQQANVWAKQGNYPKACPEYDAAVALNPALGAAQFARGVCFTWQGKKPEAIQAFQTALAAGLDARQIAYAHGSIGTAYLNLHQYEKAIPELQTAADLYASIDPSRQDECLRLLKQAKTGIPLTQIFQWANYVVPIAVALIIFILFRVPSGKKNTGETIPVPAPVHAEETSWKMEPELLSPILPRRLASRSLGQTHQWLMYLVIPIPILFLFGHGLSLVQRWYVLQNGLPGSAAVQRVYQVATGKNGRGRQTHFVLAYQMQPDQLVAGDVRVAAPMANQAGQTLPIHYLPDRPGWVALDDDYGQSSREGNVLKVTLIIPVFLAGCFAYKQRKQRYLLMWGKAVAATVSHLDQKLCFVYLTYELNGQKREVNAQVDSPASYTMGETVTALVDDRYPKYAVIYSDAPYRVL
jgi:tetratricopeptide (TPR) repeat protein